MYVYSGTQYNQIICRIHVQSDTPWCHLKKPIYFYGETLSLNYTYVYEWHKSFQQYLMPMVQFAQTFPYQNQ